MSDNFFRLKNGATFGPGLPAAPSNPKNGDIYFDSTLGKLQKYENGVWQGLGSGSGGGGINYLNSETTAIDSSTFEATLGAWVVYADAAGVRPVDGTGGSPLSTLALSTSNPLRQAQSALLSKPASNRQGEGVSVNFTIDKADQGKVLAIGFDYILASGAFAAGNDTSDSDLEVFVYDVTNATLIDVTPYKLNSNSSTAPAEFTGLFQTSINSTSYRLILHMATTSAAAYTWRFDNVSVGPQPVSYSANVSDWAQYSPIVTGLGSGSGTFQEARYRRVGGVMHLRVAFTKDGTAGSGGGGVGFSLPPGFSGDAFVAPGAELGQGYTRSVNTSTLDIPLIVRGGAGFTSFDLMKTNSPGNNVSGGDILANAVISFEAWVPILGWSSPVIVTSDADARVLALSSSGGSGTMGSGTWLVNPAVNIDTHAGYNATTGEYRAPMSGFYEVNSFISTTAAGTANIHIFINGNIQGGTRAKVNTASPNAYVGGLVYCTAGDLISIGTTAGGLGYNDATFDVQKISGPSFPSATEFVGMFYYEGSGFTLNPSPQVASFLVRSYDTHNAWDPSTGTFTAPVAGKYRVEFKINMSIQPLTLTGTSLVGANNSTDGLSVIIDQQPHQQTASSFGRTLGGSITFNCEAGKTIQITAALNGAVTGNVGGGGGDDSYLCIHKVNV